jgi:hypothetical protein
MPNFASQLSLDQLKRLTCKSVARASQKYGIKFMTEAVDAVATELTVDERRRLVEACDFGNSVARWYAAHLFFHSRGLAPSS